MHARRDNNVVLISLVVPTHIKKSITTSECTNLLLFLNTMFKGMVGPTVSAA